MEHDVVGDDGGLDSAVHHAPEHGDRVPEPAGPENAETRAVYAPASGPARRRGARMPRRGARARHDADGGGEDARVVEHALAVELARGVEGGERGARLAA